MTSRLYSMRKIPLRQVHFSSLSTWNRFWRPGLGSGVVQHIIILSDIAFFGFAMDSLWTSHCFNRYFNFLESGLELYSSAHQDLYVIRTPYMICSDLQSLAY
jgi:hypothetical protein